MMKFRLIAAGAIACMMTLFSSGVAQAYSDCGIDLQITDATLVGGKTFNFTVDSGAIDCAWTVTYRGKVKKGNGTSFSGTFSTPVVTKKTTSILSAVCTWESGNVSSSRSASSSVASAFYSTAPVNNLQAIERSCPTEATVTLLPKGGLADDGDALPNTGGSNLALILLGGGLLLVGGGVTYMARRRSSSH